VIHASDERISDTFVVYVETFEFGVASFLPALRIDGTTICRLIRCSVGIAR
jgi:hypothetical protein